ncbi:MAG: nickel pincer cofactor biosynthesis protein LarB [Bacteroidota bacterium]|nr:nickel pincer cofactor biosynthesis protein LarB [Bacteroidota bacterium]
MTPEEIKKILQEVKDGKATVDSAMDLLRDLPFEDVGFAKIDHHRELRTGYPEVIFCAGKTIPQVVKIVEMMYDKGNNILGTRTTEEVAAKIQERFPETEYNEAARAFVIKRKTVEYSDSYISIVTAGTADIPVAEEAAITAEIFGNRVERIFDVGVAGIHRLYQRLDLIRGGKVIVAVAGMEGALASVIGGLVNKPIIAVPTSVGYGANFNGLSALLTMLNSCSAGVSVVNIDNGFGAGYIASMINRIGSETPSHLIP